MLKQIYRLLRTIADPAVDRAMAEALPTAEPEAQQLLVLSLLARRDQVARMALVRHFHLLPQKLQQLVVSEVPRLDAVMRAAAEHDEPTTRLNLVDLVTRSQSFRLAYLLSAQLHHNDSRVRRAAALGLLNIAQLVEDPTVASTAADATQQEPTVSNWGGGGAGTATKPQRVRWVATALAEACSCYHQHGRQDALAAAAVLGPACPRELMHQLTDRRCAAHAVLREMIRRGDRTEIQQALLSFAPLAALEPMVVESLNARTSPERLALIWPTAHLLAVPDVRSAVRKATRGTDLLPADESLAAVSPEAARLVPRWVLAVRADRPEQAAALTLLAGAEDRVTRLLALRALIALQDVAADERIAPMCYDAEPAIARMALRHLRRRKWHGLTRLMVKLVSSAHPGVRRLAEHELAPVGFDRLWRHWGQMDAATQVSAGRAVMKIDRRFHEQLGRKLDSSDDGIRFKAVMMVRRLELANEHEHKLMELVRDQQERVASAAAGALGMVGESPEVAQRLEEALDHEDDRVRANAIESLESLGQAEQANARLRRLAEGAENRSRATAIAALMKLPTADAMPELASMLADERADHRASALWVIEQLGLAPLARQVVDLARHDQDRTIRERALAVYKHMVDKADPLPATDDADPQAQPGGKHATSR